MSKFRGSITLSISLLSTLSDFHYWQPPKTRYWRLVRPYQTGIPPVRLLALVWAHNSDLPLSCICIFGSILKILLLKPLLFFLILRNVNSLYLKYHRSCTIIATGNHHSLIIRPPMHDGTTLQCGINISADSIPCFATELSVHQMIKIILLRCPCEPHMAKVTCFQTL